MTQLARQKMPFFQRAEKIRIEFSKSSSKNFALAVKLISKHPNYSSSNDQHFITFESNSNEDMILMNRLFNIVINWKSLVIQIDNSPVSNHHFKQAMACFSYRAESLIKDEYCNQYNRNRLKCRQIYLSSLETNSWYLSDGFGVFDKTGVWHFFKDKILKQLASECFYIRFCPALDIENLKKIFDEIPEFIDPRINKEWDYVYPRSLAIVISFGRTEQKPNRPIGVKKLQKWENRELEYIPFFDDSNSINSIDSVKSE